MADYDKLLQVPRATKAKLEQIKLELLANTIVYATDTNELGIKLSNGNIEYFMNATDINARIGIININYADLVILRNSSDLEKGVFYRIIDYETTTLQEETKSAGHLFDIIVQALDEKTLSENAFAINSSRDTAGYFSGMRLGAWKLKYTLENDRLKYYWADPTNGKGVIYRMIDEYENDLPYDFKNIQFKRYKISAFAKNTALTGKYYALKNLGENVLPETATIDSQDFIWAYTFTTKVTSDESYIETTTLNKYIGINDEGIPRCSKNVFGDHGGYLYDELLYEHSSYFLGNNVIYSEIEVEANAMYFFLPHSNTIGNNFNYNTIGNDFHSNNIGNAFINNTISTIGNAFRFNTIGNSFSNNIVGDDFRYNSIGHEFRNNAVGNEFRYNTIGNYFYFNTFGNDFYGNAIGNRFDGNTFGNSFRYNTIGNDFRENSIGDSFYFNAIGNNIWYIQFSLDGTILNRIRYLYLKDGLSGASSNNKLDLYYEGLYGREYSTTFELAANGNVISSWEATPLIRVGKVKETKTTTTWSDVLITNNLGDIESALDAILGV